MVIIKSQQKNIQNQAKIFYFLFKIIFLLVLIFTVSCSGSSQNDNTMPSEISETFFNGTFHGSATINQINEVFELPFALTLSVNSPLNGTLLNLHTGTQSFISGETTPTQANIAINLRGNCTGSMEGVLSLIDENTISLDASGVDCNGPFTARGMAPRLRPATISFTGPFFTEDVLCTAAQSEQAVTDTEGLAFFTPTTEVILNHSNHHVTLSDLERELQLEGLLFNDAVGQTLLSTARSFVGPASILLDNFSTTPTCTETIELRVLSEDDAEGNSLTTCRTEATSEQQVVACTFRVVREPPNPNLIEMIELPANNLIYDPMRQVIYASIPGRAGAPYGNTITLIDPETAILGESIVVGSEPNPLALSDDGQFLYVGLDGTAAVRRINLSSMTAGLQFSLGNDDHFGPYFVERMAVLPGQPESVAISRRRSGVSPRHGGVAIFDNNVQRSLTTNDHSGSNVIAFSGSASVLYGYNNETTEFGFRRMTVDASGVVVDDITRDLISGFSADIVFDSGLIYATTGRVIDPESLMLQGTFIHDESPFFGNSVVPDSTLGRVFFLGGLGEARINAFDQHTFVLLDTFTITTTGLDRPSSLIRWGMDGLAFRTDSDQIILISGPLVDPTSEGTAIPGIQ